MGAPKALCCIRIPGVVPAAAALNATSALALQRLAYDQSSRVTRSPNPIAVSASTITCPGMPR